MNVTVYGAGYVGLVTSVCLAKIGHHVICQDIDAKKIKLLSKAKPTLYEIGLGDLLKETIESKRLTFTTDAEQAVKHGSIQIIAVGTPPLPNGGANLEHVYEVIANLNRFLKQPVIIVNKSTVPIGTADLVAQHTSLPVTVVSNPEFLREGRAIEDFMHPDKIIIGTDNNNAAKVMRDLYAPLLNETNELLIMDTRSAELTKYATNAFLATKISFMNEVSHIAEKYGADIDFVRSGMALDSRIGKQFLYAGCGYGGSCFPKDVSALITMAKDKNINPQLLNATESVNHAQKRTLLNKIHAHFGHNLNKMNIAIWGMAFKPGTDDMRCAPSLEIIQGLLESGARVSAYDPRATENAKKVFHHRNLYFADSAVSALQDADALVLITEWNEFLNWSARDIAKCLKQKIVFDGRNIFDQNDMYDAGIIYYGIGKKEPKNISSFSNHLATIN